MDSTTISIIGVGVIVTGALVAWLVALRRELKRLRECMNSKAHRTDIKYLSDAIVDTSAQVRALAKAAGYEIQPNNQLPPLRYVAVKKEAAE